MAGTGSLTTDETVRMSRFAEDVGADAVIVVPITYWPLTDNEVYEHYSRVAKAIKISSFAPWRFKVVSPGQRPRFNHCGRSLFGLS